MQSRLERKIEQDVVDYMKGRYGVESIKWLTTGNKGWPDRVFLLPLRPAWIEFKRKGEKPKKLQAYRMKCLAELGYDVMWTDDKNVAINWLEKLHAARLSEARNQTNDKQWMRWLISGSGTRKDVYISRGLLPASK